MRRIVGSSRIALHRAASTPPPPHLYRASASALHQHLALVSLSRQQLAERALHNPVQSRSFSTEPSVSNSSSSTPAFRTKSKRQKELACLVQALRLFHEKEGHFAVPIAFEIPRSTAWPSEVRGLALGMKTHKLMHHIASGKAPKGSEEYIQALEKFGFPVYTWRRYIFHSVLVPALTCYAREHGNLFVPQKYVVPKAAKATTINHQWPRETWGYPLGLQVSKLRREKRLMEDEDVEALDAIGFVWSVRDAKWNNYFLPGMRLFKELFGHVDVPLAFEIPLNDPAWPTHLQGYHLGRHVYMVRSGKYAEYVARSKHELNSLGFAFDLSDSLWTFTIFPALEAFAHVHGHCDVPQDFVVPAEDPWPESGYGWRLGHTVKSIRHQGIYEDQVRRCRAELDRIAFVWNAADRVEVVVRRIVLPAMKAYSQMHGDVLIGTDFVVPDHSGAGKWPQQARGFRLGHWITRARGGQIELPRVLRDELDQLGFVWRFNDQRWNEVLLPAFQAYAKIHGSCKGMSTKFVVPYDNDAYPIKSWGVNLGGALWHMKNGDTYVHDPVKERELKKLGVL